MLAILVAVFMIGAGVAIGVVLMMVLGARATLSATEVMLRGRFDDEELPFAACAIREAAKRSANRSGAGENRAKKAKSYQSCAA